MFFVQFKKNFILIKKKTDPPLVYLAIGANLKNEMITVGSDVSFECNIQVSLLTF